MNDADEVTQLRAVVERLTDQLGALAITVDRVDTARQQITPKVQTLETHLGNLSTEMLTMNGALAGLRRSPDAPEPSDPTTDWMTVDDVDRAVEVMVALHRWVQRVWTQYTPTAACWPWHPPVVAELLACRGVHGLTIRKGAPATITADWHTRLRPTAERTISGRLASCNPTTGHQEGKAHFDVDPNPVMVAEYARWWASTHGTSRVSAPGLTPKATT